MCSLSLSLSLSHSLSLCLRAHARVLLGIPGMCEFVRVICGIFPDAMKIQRELDDEDTARIEILKYSKSS
jgi:hypothetical protein